MEMNPLPPPLPLPPLPPCPCGLSYEKVEGVLTEGGLRLCQAVDLNGNPCGKRLADHPSKSVTLPPGTSTSTSRIPYT